MENVFKFALVLLLQLCSTHKVAMAQGVYTDVNVQEWPSGIVVLASGDSIFGAIAYHCEEDVIKVVKEDGAVSTFSPVNVQHFIVSNNYTGKQQVFKTFYWNMGRDYSDFKKPTFFEQLNEGKFTLIMRETFVERNAQGVVDFSKYRKVYNPKTATDGYLADEVKASYYVLMPDGEIKALKHPRRDLLRLFGKKSSQIKKYVTKNKLDFDLPNELVAIVKYYNTL